ncbi:hypothetical protein AMS68_007075 [Peltaster fructicola]|uniref:Uncharacterized protein n=1 Tax=Peltaster fructicola TaxID=286661 RepID=A0A6H0Y3Z1_9PEZI|nr:hypothetical protein AMS68_007075 [Peltaster fructicola]
MSLLALPAELRELIYNHLMPQEWSFYPFLRVGQASSRKPPRLPMLLVHQILTGEILHFFTKHTTWVIIPGNSLNHWQYFDSIPNESIHRRLVENPYIRFMQVVELIIYQYDSWWPHHPLTPEHTEYRARDELFCSEIQQIIRETCDALCNYAPLRWLIVTWYDGPHLQDWSDKPQMFAAFERLGDRTVLGDVLGHRDHEYLVRFRSAFLAHFEECDTRLTGTHRAALNYIEGLMDPMGMKGRRPLSLARRAAVNRRNARQGAKLLWLPPIEETMHFEQLVCTRQRQ